MMVLLPSRLNYFHFSLICLPHHPNSPSHHVTYLYTIALFHIKYTKTRYSYTQTNLNTTEANSEIYPWGNFVCKSNCHFSVLVLPRLVFASFSQRVGLYFCFIFSKVFCLWQTVRNMRWRKTQTN